MRCNLTIKRELGQDLRGCCQQQQTDPTNPIARTTGGCGRLVLMNSIGEGGLIPTGEIGGDSNPFFGNLSASYSKIVKKEKKEKKQILVMKIHKRTI